MSTISLARKEEESLEAYIARGLDLAKRIDPSSTVLLSAGPCQHVIYPGSLKRLQTNPAAVAEIKKELEAQNQIANQPATPFTPSPYGTWSASVEEAWKLARNLNAPVLYQYGPLQEKVYPWSEINTTISRIIGEAHRFNLSLADEV